MGLEVKIQGYDLGLQESSLKVGTGLEGTQKETKFCGWEKVIGIEALRLRFGPESKNLSLEAEIRALRLGFGPRGWDLGFDAGI